MKDVALFEKVSREEYEKTLRIFYPAYDFSKDELDAIYDNIRIPTRGTKKAGGYDFYTPIDFVLAPGCKVAIPTGIRVNILKDEFCLFMFPKSRNAKTSIRLSNTIGLIDGDYYDSSNEGHIIIFLEMPTDAVTSKNHSFLSLFGSRINKASKEVHFMAGQSFVQGSFLETGLVVGDNTTTIRNGGFGSTGDN